MKSSVSAQKQPHKQEKSQGSAIAVEDAIIIIRDINLCDMNCSKKTNFHPVSSCSTVVVQKYFV
jgi:hypothetical protein